MPRCFAIFAFILASFCPFGLGHATEQPPDGFRGMRWGDPVPEGFRLYERFGGFEVYTKDDDSLGIFDAQASQIRYRFCNNKFSNVSVVIERQPSIKADLERKFGKLERIEQYPGDSYKLDSGEINITYVRSSADIRVETFGIGNSRLESECLSPKPKQPAPGRPANHNDGF